MSCSELKAPSLPPANLMRTPLSMYLAMSMALSFLDMLRAIYEGCRLLMLPRRWNCDVTCSAADPNVSIRYTRMSWLPYYQVIVLAFEYPSIKGLHSCARESTQVTLQSRARKTVQTPWQDRNVDLLAPTVKDPAKFAAVTPVRSLAAVCVHAPSIDERWD
jgi:hypothetical protein